MAIVEGSFARVDSAGDAVPTDGATARIWFDDATFQSAVAAGDGVYPPVKGTADPHATHAADASTTTGTSAGSKGGYRFSGLSAGDYWVMCSYGTDDPVWEPRSIGSSVEAPTTDDILYVSYANGADTNTGRSEGTALKTIQAAIDALGATGGIIRLAPGGHTITAAISIATTNDLTIQGMGMNKTLIDVNADISAITVSGVCNRITLKDFTISSGTARTAGKYGISIIGTVGTHTADFSLESIGVYNMPSPIYTRYAGGRMENCKIVSSIAGAVTGHGVHCANGAGIRLRDVTVAGSNITTLAVDGDGFCMDSDTDTVLLDGCEAYNTLGAGFSCRNSLAGTSGPRLARFNNCWAEGAQARGYDVDTGRDVRFSGCHAADNDGTAGYVVTAGDSITFSDCLATANKHTGFYVAGGEGVEILGCTASNNSIEAVNTNSGITIAADVIHARIIGNRSGDFIYTVAAGGDQKYGIELVAGASDYLIISNNDLLDNVTARMLNSSTGTHNVIEDLGIVSTTADFTGTFNLNGTSVVATAAEINRTCDNSTRIVNATDATLAVTAALHDGKVVTLNRAASQAVTLPAATGSGAKLHFVVGTTVTTPSTTIKVTGNDTMTGTATILQDAADTASAFETAADSDTITLNGTTTGGIKGDSVELIDIAADLWWVRALCSGTSTEATPFSATV